MKILKSVFLGISGFIMTLPLVSGQGLDKWASVILIGVIFGSLYLLLFGPPFGDS